MSTGYRPGQETIASLGETIRIAEEDAQDAQHRGDSQARGYADGRALRAKRRLAMLDPRGYGHGYLNLLTAYERAKADASLRAKTAADIANKIIKDNS